LKVSHFPKTKKKQFLFLWNDVLAEFADIIIPTTKSSAGAKAAGLGTYSHDDSRLSTQKCNYFCFGFERNGIKMYRRYNKNFVP
jgi:hypothetical protein